METGNNTMEADEEKGHDGNGNVRTQGHPTKCQGTYPLCRLVLFPNNGRIPRHLSLPLISPVPPIPTSEQTHVAHCHDDDASPKKKKRPRARHHHIPVG